MSTGLQFTKAPPEGTIARHWWDRGAEAEAACRVNSLSPAAIEVLTLLEALAQLNPGYSGEKLALAMARVYCPGELKRRRRLRHWLHSLIGVGD
jgi:hypothetical protein